MAFKRTPERWEVIVPGDVNALAEHDGCLQVGDGADGGKETAQKDEADATILSRGHLCLPQTAKREAVDGYIEGDVEGCAGVNHDVGLDAVAFMEAVPALPGVVDGRALEGNHNDEDDACAAQDADQDEADDPKSRGVAADRGLDP